MIQAVFTVVCVVALLDALYLSGLVIKVVQNQGADNADFLSLTPLVVLFSALMALIAFLWNAMYKNSEDKLIAAQGFYEKAYEVLNAEPVNERLPRSRARWLTAARLLQTAQKVGASSMLRIHKRMHADLQDYWRSKLRDMFLERRDVVLEQQEHEGRRPRRQELQGRHERYEASGILDAIKHKHAVFDEKSVTVIFRFVRWPSNRSDPLKRVRSFSEKELNKMYESDPIVMAEMIDTLDDQFDRRSR